MKNSMRGAIEPFLALEAFRDAKALEREGHDIIHMTLGQPSRELPQSVLDKVVRHMSSQPLGYTELAGHLPLREALVEHYHTQYGINLPLERVVVTVGSSAAFFMSVMAAFDAGDRIAIALPCYPAYPNMLKAMNIEPVYLRPGKAHKFQPTVEMVKALPQKPHGLIIASPSNPSGTILDAEELQRLCEYCDAEGIRIISDEIYHGISYGPEVASVAQFSPRAIVINSFSKYYLMPGWRLGWAVMAEDLAAQFANIAGSFFISPPAISQYAALEIVKQRPVLDDIVAGYARNRAIMLRELPLAGFDDLAPAEGAFYIYADVSKLTNDSTAFCKRMLHEAGVAAVSGVDFDREQGNRMIRFSFSASEEKIAEAMRRIRSWVQEKS